MTVVAASGVVVLSVNDWFRWGRKKEFNGEVHGLAIKRTTRKWLDRL